MVFIVLCIWGLTVQSMAKPWCPPNWCSSIRIWICAEAANQARWSYAKCFSYFWSCFRWVRVFCLLHPPSSIDSSISLKNSSSVSGFSSPAAILTLFLQCSILRGTSLANLTTGWNRVPRFNHHGVHISRKTFIYLRFAKLTLSGLSGWRGDSWERRFCRGFVSHHFRTELSGAPIQFLISRNNIDDKVVFCLISRDTCCPSFCLKIPDEFFGPLCEERQVYPSICFKSYFICPFQRNRAIVF